MKTLSDAYKLFHDGAVALARVEQSGIRVDRDYLDSTTERVEKEIKTLQDRLCADAIFEKWKSHFREKTVLGSHSQLATVIFDILGYENRGYSEKSQKYKAEESSFAHVDLAFVRDYFRAEKLKKLARTYFKGIYKEMVDGFIHPFFNLHTARTYRSCVAKGTFIEVVRDVKNHPKGIPIEQVKIGDLVYCYDDSNQLKVRRVVWSGNTGNKKVIRLHWVARGKRGFLDVTPEHKIRLSSGNYIEARLLDGADLRRPVGDFVPNNHKIVRVEWLDEPTDVYDLEVEEFHNFIANGICVHNSSSAPNFQNIPIRDPEIGKLIRRAFVPRRGRRLVEIDFSTLEFRIAASFWQDPGMLAYASDPSKDIHRDQASLLFLCDKERAKHKPVRQISKNQFVFPILYGSYYVSCTKNIWQSVTNKNKDGFYELCFADKTPVFDWLQANNVDRRGLCDPSSRPTSGSYELHVKRVEEQFYDSFSTFKERKDKWWSDYQRRGFFMSPTGFVMSGVYSRNFLMNAPIQSSAFHCLLQALIWLQNWLDHHDMRSLLVAQIHDCLLLDVAEDELQDVLHVTQHFMTKKLRKHWSWILTPMEVEVDVTPIDGDWSSKQAWHEVDEVWQPKVNR